MADNIYVRDGVMYTASPAMTARMTLGGARFPTGESLQNYIKQGSITPLNISSQPSQQMMSSYPSTKFTPNAFTQAQLQGMNNMQTPQWMMDAYSNKIGRMGGNANLPPFGVTPSGFPGIAGKTAPTQGS